MDPSRIIWTPSEEQRRTSVLASFLRFASSKGAPVDVGDYAGAWRWSVGDLDSFWRVVWDFFAVRPDAGSGPVLVGEMPQARWFPRAQLSFASHVFRSRSPDAIALWACGEDGRRQAVTWQELREMTAAIATALRRRRVERGDRVAAVLPNIPEAVAAMLAANSIGAVWSCCSPDLGADAILDRLAQIEPTVLLAVDGYRYGGREFDRGQVVSELIDALPSVRVAAVLPRLGGRCPERAMSWTEFIGTRSSDDLTFEMLPFEHPLWILYSSGTTGLPKAIVHSQGGILLEHLKHLGLHLDLRPDDCLFWFTTTGWMMWNFLVGGLLRGARVVLYDGSPTYPSADSLWQLADELEVTHFGTSPAFIRVCQKRELQPRHGRDLDPLRVVGATGGPLPADGYDWVYERLGPDVWLASLSGGTDVCSAFVGGCPLLPVRRGRIQAPSLGCAVFAFDEHGQPIVGSRGELVLTKPMPSMPIGLWADDDGEKLREAYFSTYPGAWRHGDFVEIDRDGSVEISGRSDATLNRGGIRIGTAEIYRAVLQLPGITDALIVDVPQREGQSWMPLFVVLEPGYALDGALRQALNAKVREACSPRHVPDAIIAVAAVPRTRSGKLVEVPMKRILAGEDADTAISRDALSNPEAVDSVIDAARTARSSRSE